MIDGQALIGLLGKSSDSVEIQDFLRQVGAKGPKLKKGDVDAYVVLYKLGLDLLFSDEAYLTQAPDLAIGEGKLFLRHIRFTTSAIPDYATYSGTLPHGMDFALSQSDLKQKLGEPAWANLGLSAERWLIDGQQMRVRYNDQLTALEEIGFTVPRAGNR